MLRHVLRKCNNDGVTAIVSSVPTQAGTVLPDPSILPDVLPTDRLQPSGMAKPAIRDGLRHIPNGRNVLNVASVLLQSFGLVALAAWIDQPWAWVVTFVLMGRSFALYAILAHEAAHRLLFSNRRANDLIGKWVLAYPAFVPFDLYRRGHFAHHKDEMGPNEPDLNLYLGYPITRASMRRKLRRDALGSSGWKNLKGLVRAFGSEQGRPSALRILAAQVVMAALLTIVSGQWWAYPVLWLAPWMTVWRVTNRLRAIAEHGGMVRSDDRRLTTHVVHQSLLARFWLVPFNTGWHLAHHVDMGVPFRHLPELHAELVDAGWVTPELEYPSYLALWAALSSAPDEPVAAAA
jgi:fatty acid desaturase